MVILLVLPIPLLPVINLQTSINVTITGNTLKGIASATSGGYGIRGININNSTAASNTLIANNMISDVWDYQDATIDNYGVFGYCNYRDIRWH
jgi:hypothetical protein